jgi:hypothetical protein
MGAALPAGAAEKKEPPPPPPALPVPQDIQVLRGQEREITLKIHGKKNQPITYLIRKQPQSGTLTQPTNTEAEVAVVKYRPPEDRKVTQDSFQYAARSEEGVSAAVAVNIKIVDVPATLSIPQENTFPQRLVGTEEVQVIEFENLGGSMAEGEAFVDAPWQIEGSSAYRIEPKGRGFLRVKFAPQKSGRFTGELRFSSQTDRVTTLRGTAVDAIAVNPPLLALQPELTTMIRAGAVELTNHTDAPLTVKASATPPLKVDPEITLASGETRPFVVRTEPGDAMQITGKVVFEAGTFRSELSVSAETLPALIRPVQPFVNFGQVPISEDARFELPLQNFGGRTGTATLSAPPPLRVPNQPITLTPGQLMAVPIGIASGTRGSIESTVEIRMETGVSTVAVRGSMMTGIARVGPTPAPQPGPGARSTGTAAKSGPLPWSPYEIDLQQPVDQRLIGKLVGLSPKSCAIEWRADLSSASKFAAEMRELAFADGQLVQKWNAHAAFDTQKVGDRVRGTIRGLQPGRLYTVRIRAVKDGKISGPAVIQTAFTTPVPEKAFSRLGWKTMVFAIALILGGAWYWKRRRNTPPAPVVDARKTQRIFD